MTLTDRILVDHHHMSDQELEQELYNRSLLLCKEEDQEGIFRLPPPAFKRTMSIQETSPTSTSLTTFQTRKNCVTFKDKSERSDNSGTVLPHLTTMNQIDEYFSDPSYLFQ